MPEIRDGEGVVEERIRKEGNEEGKGEGGEKEEIEERDEEEVEEGWKRRWEGGVEKGWGRRKITELQHGCSGVYRSGETVRRMQAPNL